MPLQNTSLDSGLNKQEQEVMEALVVAWNKFSKLNQLHPDHLTDFRRAIHEAQHILGARVLKRDYPHYWGISGERG